MWKKIKTWLGENTKSFIWFTLITASIITILLTVSKWILFPILLVGYFGWVTYKIYKNQPI